jgi:hypothetical protein
MMLQNCHYSSLCILKKPCLLLSNKFWTI